MGASTARPPSASDRACKNARAIAAISLLSSAVAAPNRPSATETSSSRARYRAQFASATARTEADARARRSEEHTSELQYLMRISYAVFCLKKKNKNLTVHRQNI